MQTQNNSLPVESQIDTFNEQLTKELTQAIEEKKSFEELQPLLNKDKAIAYEIILFILSNLPSEKYSYQKEIFDSLIEKDAQMVFDQLSTYDAKGKTALYYAIIGKNNKFIEHLLKSIKNCHRVIDIVDKENNTLCHVAASQKNQELILALLNYDCNSWLKRNKEGHTFLELACLKDPNWTARLLQDWSSKFTSGFQSLPIDLVRVGDRHLCKALLNWQKCQDPTQGLQYYLEAMRYYQRAWNLLHSQNYDKDKDSTVVKEYRMGLKARLDRLVIPFIYHLNSGFPSSCIQDLQSQLQKELTELTKEFAKLQELNEIQLQLIPTITKRVESILRDLMGKLIALHEERSDYSYELVVTSPLWRGLVLPGLDLKLFVLTDSKDDKAIQHLTSSIQWIQLLLLSQLTITKLFPVKPCLLTKGKTLLLDRGKSLQVVGLENLENRSEKELQIELLVGNCIKESKEQLFEEYQKKYKHLLLKQPIFSSAIRRGRFDIRDIEEGLAHVLNMYYFKPSYNKSYLEQMLSLDQEIRFKVIKCLNYLYTLYAINSRKSNQKDKLSTTEETIIQDSLRLLLSLWPNNSSPSLQTLQNSFVKGIVALWKGHYSEAKKNFLEMIKAKNDNLTQKSVGIDCFNGYYELAIYWSAITYDWRKKNNPQNDNKTELQELYKFLSANLNSVCDKVQQGEVQLCTVLPEEMQAYIVNRIKWENMVRADGSVDEHRQEYVLKTLAESANLSKLKELNLSGCKGLTDSLLTQVTANASGLEILNISGCSQLMGEGNWLNQLKNVRELYISECKIERLEGHFSNLKVLSLKNCYSLTHIYLQGAYTIKFINIFGCPNLPNAENFFNFPWLAVLPPGMTQNINISAISKLFLAYVEEAGHGTSLILQKEWVEAFFKRCKQEEELSKGCVQEILPIALRDKSPEIRQAAIKILETFVGGIIQKDWIIDILSKELINITSITSDTQLDTLTQLRRQFGKSLDKQKIDWLFAIVLLEKLATESNQSAILHHLLQLDIHSQVLFETLNTVIQQMDNFSLKVIHGLYEIRKITDEQAVHLLLPAINSKKKERIYEVVKILGQLKVESSDEKIVSKILRALLEFSTNIWENIRQAAIEELAQWNRIDKQMVETIQVRLINVLRKDTSPEVRVAAANALGQLGAPNQLVIESLLQVLSHNKKEKEKVRIAAIRALGQLVSIINTFLQSPKEILSVKEKMQVEEMKKKIIKQLRELTSNKTVVGVAATNALMLNFVEERNKPVNEERMEKEKPSSQRQLSSPVERGLIEQALRSLKTKKTKKTKVKFLKNLKTLKDLENLSFVNRKKLFDNLLGEKEHAIRALLKYLVDLTTDQPALKMLLKYLVNLTVEQPALKQVFSHLLNLSEKYLDTQVELINVPGNSSDATLFLVQELLKILPEGKTKEIRMAIAEVSKQITKNDKILLPRFLAEVLLGKSELFVPQALQILSSLPTLPDIQRENIVQEMITLALSSDTDKDKRLEAQAILEGIGVTALDWANGLLKTKDRLDELSCLMVIPKLIESNIINEKIMTVLLVEVSKNDEEFTAELGNQMIVLCEKHPQALLLLLNSSGDANNSTSLRNTIQKILTKLTINNWNRDELIKIFQQIFNKANPKVCLEALNFIESKLLSKNVLPGVYLSLLKIIQDPNQPNLLRCKSLQMLKKILFASIDIRENVRETLLKILDEANSEVCLKALEIIDQFVLKGIFLPDVCSPLSKIILDSNITTSLRCESLKRLGELSKDDLINMLPELLKEKNHEVCLEALEVFFNLSLQPRELKDNKSLEQIISALLRISSVRNNPLDLRIQSLTVLNKLSNLSPTIKQKFDKALNDIIKNEKNEEYNKIYYIAITLKNAQLESKNKRIPHTRKSNQGDKSNITISRQRKDENEFILYWLKIASQVVQDEDCRLLPSDIKKIVSYLQNEDPKVRSKAGKVLNHYLQKNRLIENLKAVLREIEQDPPKQQAVAPILVQVAKENQVFRKFLVQILQGAQGTSISKFIKQLLTKAAVGNQEICKELQKLFKDSEQPKEFRVMVGEILSDSGQDLLIVRLKQPSETPPPLSVKPNESTGSQPQQTLILQGIFRNLASSTETVFHDKEEKRSSRQLNL